MPLSTLNITLPTKYSAAELLPPIPPTPLLPNPIRRCHYHSQTKPANQATPLEKSQMPNEPNNKTHASRNQCGKRQIYAAKWSKEMPPQHRQIYATPRHRVFADAPTLNELTRWIENPHRFSRVSSANAPTPNKQWAPKCLYAKWTKQ